MADLDDAVTTALTGAGPFVLVTGRAWSGLEALADAAVHQVVVPTGGTALAVADGLRLGGRRAVTALDTAPAREPRPGEIVVTTSLTAAVGALSAGWRVAQPAFCDDVEQLLSRADLLLLTESAAAPGAEPDPPPLSRLRVWEDGAMAALVSSGAGVDGMRRLAQRLAARGVEVSAIELAVLDQPAHAPLVGGRRLGIAGAAVAAELRRGEWSDATTFLDVAGSDEAELVGAVLARVPAPSAG